MNTKRTPQPRAFTLVEIMIVVAIIGLLATMAIPHFARVRAQSNAVACINNLRQIEGAVQTWAFEMKKDNAESVAYADIKGYLRNLVACPAGGKSFADSYSITTVETPPTCVRQPASHKLAL